MVDTINSCWLHDGEYTGEECPGCVADREAGVAAAAKMDERLKGYDWASAFHCVGPHDHTEDAMSVYNDPDIRTSPDSGVSTATFQRADVVEIAYLAEGENDGPAWLCVGRLEDGRWFALDASCDYTGWDCQSGGHGHVEATLEAVLRLGLTDFDRERLGVTL